MRVPKNLVKNGNILDYYRDGDNISNSSIVIPPENDKELRSRKEIKEYIVRTIKDPDIQAKSVKRFEEIFKKIAQTGGTVRPLWSMGGIKEGKINQDLLDYVEIKLDGVVILEPVGQINNAMYILLDDENLQRNYTKTRSQLIESKAARKISHEANTVYNSYNFDGLGILEVIEAIEQNKEAFMKATTPQNLYSNIARVMKKYRSNIRKKEEDEGR